MPSQGSHTCQIYWPSAGVRSERNVVKPTSTSPNSSSSRSASLASLRDSTSCDQESPHRGRVLSITGTHREGTSRPITRPRVSNPIDFDCFDWDFMQTRLANKEAAAEPLKLHDSIIEPLPADKLSNNLSEVLTYSPTFDYSVDLTGFGGYKDTFALLDLRRLTHDAPNLPLSVFERICTFLDFRTYLAIRLSCRCWSAAISQISPPKLPPVYFLPAELLQHIYTYLSPGDFNAARHTSRAWMVASLETSLLSLMLKRGGWWSSAIVDSSLNYNRGLHGEKVSGEWLMSKRLSTECSLSHDWTGNGITSKIRNLSNPQIHTSGASSMILTSMADFSELNDDLYDAEHRSPLSVRFTASVCGKFVLVTKGCVIYVYHLFNRGSQSQTHGGCLEPLARIVCPGRVLAVSMDNTAQYFAVAALLQGRMGIICNLNAPRHSRQPPSPPIETQGLGTPTYKASAAGSPSSNERVIRKQANSNVTDDCSRSQSWLITGSQAAETAPSPLAILSPYDLANISIGYGSRSIYRSLCSASDPPLSVAICLQRRCVAFGCSGGIELHWIDAVTGQDLNRWFPLAGPSDFLFFLPPIKGAGSAKNLKLISSVGVPGREDGLRGMLAPDFGRRDGQSTEGRGKGEIRSRERADRYRAVPLSDGIHILFVDPVSGRLCLGSDAPLGGPTRLTGKFMFLGPNNKDDGTISDEEELGEITFPEIYAAGQDLQWGVRIVVGFGDRVWLFTIPPDIFGSEFGITRLSEEVETIINEAYSPEENHRPAKFRGLEIDTVEGLLDVAIDAAFGSLIIWAFGKDGRSYTWQMDDGQPKRVGKRRVLQDSTLIDLEDADGDVIMRDAPPLE